MLNILILISILFSFEEFEDEICIKGQDAKQKYYKLIVPSDKSEIFCIFGKKRSYAKGGASFEKEHKGVDISAPIGSDVISPFDGKVIISKNKFLRGTGKTIVIEHQLLSNKIVTSRYYHLSKRLVLAGATIKKGQLLGKVGNTGRSSGPHLHFETRIDDVPVDPEIFFSTYNELINAGESK